MVFDPALAFFIAAFTSIFTIINPFNTASVFIGITKGDSRKKKQETAKRAAIATAITLIVFAFAGNFILSFFDITVDAFKIAGGIYVGSVGYSMLKTRREHFRSKEEHKEAVRKEDVSVVPLAIPFMSGPGAITTSIVLMGQTSTVIDKSLIVTAILLASFISYLILAEAHLVEKHIGETGQHVIDKIMGLIVLVVGVQFVINGASGVIYGWIG